MPARKITRGLGTQLRAGTAGGGGVSFGGVWTAIIVTQVALTVMLPSAVMLVQSETTRVKTYDAGFPTTDYLGVTLGADSARTHSLVMCMRCNWVRFTDGIHFFARERREEVRLLG